MLPDASPVFQIGSVRSQLEALRNGFGELIPLKKCSLLSVMEFETLLCGVPEVRVRTLLIP